MNRLIDIYAKTEDDQRGNIFPAVQALGSALSRGPNTFWVPYLVVASFKRQQETMAGPRGQAMRLVRESNFALGDEVLRAEAARPDKLAHDRTTQAIREIAGRTGKRVGDVRCLRRLAAAFLPGHEGRTHPQMPGKLLECLGAMNTPARDCWYARFAGGWRPRFEAGETWEDFFYAAL